MKAKFTGNGYTIEKEIIDVLLDRNPSIDADDIERAGGGMVAVILQVQDKRRFNLRALAKDLLRSSGRGVNVAAVSLPASGGERHWKVMSLDHLRELADGLYDMRQQLRLEAALRSRG